MNEVPLVSVVVLNWNGQRFIDSFMQTFEELKYPRERLELVFTDNGSTDNSIKYLKENFNDDSRIKIVQNGKNYGYSGGNNLGLKQATGDYILICNNDLQLDKNLVVELLEVATSNNSAATVPKLMYLNRPGIINNAGSRLEPNKSWPIYDVGIDEEDKGQYDTVREINAFCGACVLFTREFLQTVGMFDKRFFMYFEDGDLSWRGQKRGYKYFYAPKAMAYHVHAGSSKEGSPLFNHFVGRNRMLILTKNASFLVIAKGWARTLQDHLVRRLKSLWRALLGKYSKKQALKEFYFSQKMILAALFMTPYALMKRYHLIKEDTL